MGMGRRIIFFSSEEAWMASKEEIDEQLIGILDELSALVKEKVRIFEIFKSVCLVVRFGDMACKGAL